MKVLLINGSPNKNGCTFTALSEVEKTLRQQGIDSDWFYLGTQPIHGCLGCGKCAERQCCIFNDDPANRCIAAIQAADAVVIGSPVYYAGANGALCAMLDRVFYAGGGSFSGKPGAAVVSCRRGGAGSAFDRLNKYFTISGMPVVSSQYWNSVHGNSPEEVLQDAEGLQIMRTLGSNLAWMLRCIKQSGIPLPEPEPRVMTNFIR